MTSNNVQYLREHGPSPVSDLRNHEVTVSDRMNGVWKFKLTGCTSNGGGAVSTGGRISPIAYLKDEHDKRQVLKAFLDVNENLVEAKTRDGLRRMLRRHGKSWHEAIDDVIPP